MPPELSKPTSVQRQLLKHPLLQQETVRQGLLAIGVLGALAGAVSGQIFLEHVRPPYTPPPDLQADGSNAHGLLQRITRIANVASAFNRASDAARIADRVAFAAALNDLRVLKAGSRAAHLALPLAEDAVLEAARLDIQAESLKGAEAKELQAKAAVLYREALKLSPVFNSDSADLVNFLGYFLAERGTTLSDFRTAERLTQRAVQMMDAQMEELKQQSVGSQDDRERMAKAGYSRGNIRDSLAWALYRQERYTEAIRAQQLAIIETTFAAKIVGEKVPAELHFHLGEMYRATKRFDEAREQYQTALKIEPDNIESQHVLKQLLPEPAPAKPSPKSGTQKSPPPGPGEPIVPGLPGLEKPAPAEPETEEPEASEPGGEDALPEGILPEDLLPETPSGPYFKPLSAQM